MTIKVTKLALTTAAAFLLASTAMAGPITLSDKQMDAVAAAGAPSPNGFVCPVISTNAVLNSPKSAEPEPGLYTIIGPNVRVPIGATNDDGAGNPHGPFVSPGDTTYTAIWHTGS